MRPLTINGRIANIEVAVYREYAQDIANIPRVSGLSFGPIPRTSSSSHSCTGCGGCITLPAMHTLPEGDLCDSKGGVQRDSKD
jgi:hypothetical protein